MRETRQYVVQGRCGSMKVVHTGLMVVVVGEKRLDVA